MSGILGIHYLNHQPVDSDNLQQMVDVLAHRGPDGAHIWVDGAIGLGHRMLWTTPESLLETLPCTNEPGNLVITADARIDNRDELREMLRLPDRPLEKITDSEFILAAYEQWGEQCPEYLLGDFAFAIWDQSNQTLFCARDHFGIKPFYYYHQPGNTFLFASEIKALLCLPDVPRQLNEVRIGDYLTMMMEDNVSTVYQDILRLPPAHGMVVNQSGIQTWSYWTLNLHHEILLESDEAYANEFRKRFTEAVRCRLRSAFPIASHLSGGLDSSAITCVARQLLVESGSAPLHTISNIFDDVPECDERPFINEVLAQGELIPHYVHPDHVGPLSELQQIWQYEDEGYVAFNHFLVWGLNRAAQQAGTRIALDGFDGDTTVSHGAHRFTELVRRGEWQTFVEEAVAVAPRFNLSPRAIFESYAADYLRELARQFRWVAFAKQVHQIRKHVVVSPQHLIYHYGLKALIPERLRQLWHRLRGRQNETRSPIALVNPSFANRIQLKQRIDALAIPDTLPLNDREHQWRSLTTSMRTFVLEQSDRYAAAFGLEVRHPFMDKRLIEFCLALPSDQKLKQGWTRMVMRRALAGSLPEAVQWRGGKTDVSPNFRHGLLTLNSQILENVFCNQLGSIAHYVDVDLVKQAYRRVTSGKQFRNNDLTIIWRAATLTLWLEHRQTAP